MRDPEPELPVKNCGGSKILPLLTVLEFSPTGPKAQTILPTAPEPPGDDRPRV